MIAHNSASLQITEPKKMVFIVECTQNTVADALFRLEEINLPLTLEDLARAQRIDPSSNQACLQHSLKWLQPPGSTGTVLCDTTTAQPRPYLPTALQADAVYQYHSLSHPGIRSTRRPSRDSTGGPICAET